MAARRSLIVVSNRGPFTYDLDAAGNRVRRRGGGGLVTALRGLLEHQRRHVDRECDDGRGPSVAAEGAGDGDVVLVAHDPEAYDGLLQRDREPPPVVHPALPLGSRDQAGPRSPHARCVDRRVRAPSTGRSPKRGAQLDNKPEALVFFHDYHLLLAPRIVRDARPMQRSHTSCTSHGPKTERPAGGDAASDL